FWELKYVEENHFLFPSLKMMLESTPEKIPAVSGSRA
ncbi:MAG: DUF3155 domain-containing protein, partial [Oscillatoriales cyanobacterium RU_3_3]|nr:DUF3155 domain-containing protein [Oscillatoriales cyanobacterium RU_3_3]